MALEGRYSEKKVISLLEESVTANDAKRQEIIEALSKPKIGGTKTEKRNLLGSILDNQTIIASTIRSLNQNQLAKEFEVICAGRTSRTIANDRKYPAEKLAELYMDIGSIYDRFEKLSSSLKTDTRNILIIDNLLKVYRIAQQEVVHGRQENLKSYLHKLSPAEQARGYLVDGSIPADPALRSCPICGHDKVDEPDTNIQNWFTNVERQQKYQVKLAWHEAYKVRADYEGRAPPPPILKPIYIRCGCKRIQCNGPGQTNCSFCQTMGDKRDTDSKGNCIGCAVCGCECLFACKKAKVQMIGIALGANKTQPSPPLNDEEKDSKSTAVDINGAGPSLECRSNAQSDTVKAMSPRRTREQLLKRQKDENSAAKKVQFATAKPKKGNVQNCDQGQGR